MRKIILKSDQSLYRLQVGLSSNHNNQNQEFLTKVKMVRNLIKIVLFAALNHFSSFSEIKFNQSCLLEHTQRSQEAIV